MAQGFTVKVEGLQEFRSALKKAEGANPGELTRAIKAAGAMLPSKVRGNAPRRSGALAASVGSVQASGTKGRVPVRAKYAAPVEFGRKGPAAQTLTAKYGPPPRFGYKAVADSTDEIEKALWEGIQDIVTIYGWAKE